MKTCGPFASIEPAGVTRVAAVCLATLMGGAAATHTMRGESAAVSTILAVLVIAVATFR
jgi:hypothetical protein